MSPDPSRSLIDRGFAVAQSRWFAVVEPARLARARASVAPGPYPTSSALVSFPIATYNRARILCERTIPSILAQTHRNVELIVVGDGAIDDTEARVQELNDPRVRFIALPRDRYPHAAKERWFVVGSTPRNTGIRAAKGEWIYIISDDDVVHPNAVETLLGFAATSDAESVTAAFECLDRDATRVMRSDEGHRAMGFAVGGIPAWMYRSYLKCFSWNRHSWKKAWNRPSDYDLMLRMRNAGVRMAYLDEVVASVPADELTGFRGSAAFVEHGRRGLV